MFLKEFFEKDNFERSQQRTTECTASDLTKAKITLDTVITMVSEYCDKPFM